MRLRRSCAHSKDQPASKHHQGEPVCPVGPKPSLAGAGPLQVGAAAPTPWKPPSWEPPSTLAEMAGTGACTP